MISIKGLTKRFTQWKKVTSIFDNLDIDIPEWKFISIIWKSGSWKTTFLNLIAGLTHFQLGEIIFKRKRYSKMTDDQLTQFRWKNISFIFQQFHLIPNLTVQENIELPLNINNTKARYKVSDIIQKVWLEWKENSYPYELSGGEQQRVAIARWFITKTPILLADEPTWNLDNQNAINIMKILKKLHSEAKNTIILITHDRQIAKYWDTIYELKNKKFINK